MLSAPQVWAPGTASTLEGKSSNCVAARSRYMGSLEQHTPGADVVEALEQSEQRRLARTQRPDDHGLSAPGDGERHVAQDGLIGPVGEAHVLETDDDLVPIVRDRLVPRLAGRARRDLCSLLKLADAVQRADALLQRRHRLEEHQDGHGDEEDVQQKRDEIAQRQRA